MAVYIRLVGWLLFCLTFEVFLISMNFPVRDMVERVLSKNAMPQSVEQNIRRHGVRVPPVTDRVVTEGTGFDLSVVCEFKSEPQPLAESY